MNEWRSEWGADLLADTGLAGEPFDDPGRTRSVEIVSRTRGARER
jgi:hypothetical protein